MNSDPVVKCPYDERHVMNESRLRAHIVKGCAAKVNPQFNENICIKETKRTLIYSLS